MWKVQISLKSKTFILTIVSETNDISFVTTEFSTVNDKEVHKISKYISGKLFTPFKIVVFNFVH